jgi:hypothetical protein
MQIRSFSRARFSWSAAVAFLGMAILLTLSSCETPEVARSSNESARASRFAEAPPDRPGLGTKWGERRESRVQLTGFVRAEPDHPLVTAALHYNDAAGIRAMTSASWHRGWAALPGSVQSVIDVGLKDESGRFLPGLMLKGRWFVVGEEGRRYVLLIRNKTNARIEVVASVDGLDVIDGRSASMAKRGYLMEPHSQQRIEGFRQSTDAVAAFRFSPVRESYAAEKNHDTRNVGVVGVAVFEERGSILTSDPETRKRLNANPFPGRFAAPPR